jgi:hypothetical protein
MILVHVFQQQHAPEQPNVVNASEKCVSEERAVTHPDPASERILRTQRRSERRQQWRSEKKHRQRMEKRQLRKEERRRRINEQRLEGQRREFDRIRDTRMKAEEETTAVRTQSQVRGNSDEDNHDQRCRDDAPRVHDRQQVSRRTKTKTGGRQAATETNATHLKHDPQAGKAGRPTTMNEGCRESHLTSHVCVPRLPWHNETVLIGSGHPRFSQSLLRPLRHLPQPSRLTWGMAMPAACVRITRQAWKQTTSSIPLYDRRLASSLCHL